MNVSDLFSENMEPALNEWIRKFTSPSELFAAIPQMFIKLKSQNIHGIVEDGAIVVGPVHIGEGSVVQCQAVIRGPAIIGSDTFVSSHAEILPGCFIASNCRIGHGCSIIESMVMENVIVCHAAFVRNSVLGFGTFVGPGAVLGPVKPGRLKGGSLVSKELGVALGDRGAVGANSTLTSGTIIGCRTVIGEGVLAEGIYGPDREIRASSKLEIKPRS